MVPGSKNHLGRWVQHVDLAIRDDRLIAYRIKWVDGRCCTSAFCFLYLFLTIIVFIIFPLYILKRSFFPLS
jgi:hypothetical protein